MAQQQDDYRFTETMNVQEFMNVQVVSEISHPGIKICMDFFHDDCHAHSGCGL